MGKVLKKRLDKKILLLILVAAFCASIAAYLRLSSRVRDRHYLVQRCLLNYNQSPWMKLYLHGDDIGFLNTMGFTRVVFNDILVPFTARWEARPHGLGIQVTKINAAMLLGLALHYLNSTMAQHTLKMVFGMTQVSRHLKLGLELLYATLKHDLHHARIQWPSHEEIHKWAEMIASWEPGLRGVFGMVDGLALAIQNPGNPALQRAYYNGWKQ